MVTTNEYYQKNKEKINNQNRIYRKKRRENFKNMGVCRLCGNKLVKSSTYYCKDCREYNRMKGREYVNSPKGKIHRKIYHHITKFKALQKISGKRIPVCSKCGIGDIRILTINHNNGKNSFDMKYRNKKRLTFKTIYGSIINGKRKIDDLCVLCYNCNILYEYERGKIGIDKRILENKLKEQNIINNSDFII